MYVGGGAPVFLCMIRHTVTVHLTTSHHRHPPSPAPTTSHHHNQLQALSPSTTVYCCQCPPQASPPSTTEHYYHNNYLLLRRSLGVTIAMATGSAPLGRLGSSLVRASRRARSLRPSRHAARLGHVGMHARSGHLLKGVQ